MVSKALPQPAVLFQFQHQYQSQPLHHMVLKYKENKSSTLEHVFVSMVDRILHEVLTSITSTIWVSISSTYGVNICVDFRK